ncbi:MAG: DUF5357 domain-containing protein [Cyanothece sp. SIO2G6]|nr:DUF5357 domain-containing protein [Cyanothece sp. SIO2G6]
MQFLLQYLGNITQYSLSQIWLVLNPNQPLSWKTLLSLCIFSWLMAFITSDAQWISALAGNPEEGNTTPSFLWLQMSFMRWLLFTSGWVFLCLSMAWMLAKSTVTLPGLGLKFYPAAWVVGLLSSTYIFLLGTEEVRMGAIVAWPLISATYTLFPKLITSKGKFTSPNPATRQQFVMLLFASTTVSCWLQFCILMQGWLQEYPSLMISPLEQSTFVTPLGTDPTVSKIAQETLDQTVQLLPQAQVQTWIRNVGRVSEAVNDRFQAKLLQAETAVLPLSPAVPDEPTSTEGTEDTGDEATKPMLSEDWQLRLVRDREEPRAVRLQLRSLSATPATASDAYIEYFCRIQKFTPSDGSRPGSVSSPPIPPPVPPRPISQPVPSPGENQDNGANDNGANDSSTLNPANSDSPAPDANSFDENPENYRQNTIYCEFIGLYIP